MKIQERHDKMLLEELQKFFTCTSFGGYLENAKKVGNSPIPTKAEQKEEAIERMKIMGLDEDVIRAFKKENKRYFSFSFANLYALNDETAKVVREFEREYGYLVYHITKDVTEWGTMLTLFFVGDDKYSWYISKQRLECGCETCYVKILLTINSANLVLLSLMSFEAVFFEQLNLKNALP